MCIEVLKGNRLSGLRIDQLSSNIEHFQDIGCCNDKIERQNKNHFPTRFIAKIRLPNIMAQA